jgi:hypothetical protein
MLGDARQRRHDLAAPSEMARGMPKTVQVASSCAMVRAPARAMASSPLAPSAPMPVSRMPTARDPCLLRHRMEQRIDRGRCPDTGSPGRSLM